MKKLVFLLPIALILLSGCGPFPTIYNLDEAQKYQAMSTGCVRWGIDGAAARFSDTDRLNLMPPPVVVVSKGSVSHGVFREKYVTYDMVVQDGKGRFWTFYSTAWGSLQPGDEVKP